MLTKIREKTQGVFAWIILILICVPFALWGLQNYTDGRQENSIVIVGAKEFFQRDVNQAYTQFKQQYAKEQIPEEILKTRATEKLILDELLFQHVTEEKLTIADESVRKFIASLAYFQHDGKFDKKQYQSMLVAQRLSSAQFVNRIRKALLMSQYQKAVTHSSFVSAQDIQGFFKIQNQTREIEYLTVALRAIETIPTDEEINDFYQANDFQTAEQVSVEYVELSLTKLMDDVQATEEQLEAYYQDNIDLYSTEERRKISHILFAKTNKVTEEQALANAQAAKLRLTEESFADLAAELSDDTVTAKSGGDLGLFEIGVMEPAFEKAATQLKLGDVSEPVQSKFGYHLISITELVPAKVKTLTEALTEVKQAIQQAEAETNFYELVELLTEVSFENPDNLQSVAEALGLEIQQTDLFTRDAGKGIASEPAVRNMAFSATVLQRNNSEPVELADNRLLVLHLKEYRPPKTKPLAEVQKTIIATLQTQQAKQQVAQQVALIKQQLLSGITLQEVANTLALSVEKITGLTRDSKKISLQLNQAVFKAAKPITNETTIIVVETPEGHQTVVNLLAVTDGIKTTKDTVKSKLATANIAKALGQSDYTAIMAGMRQSTSVSIKE